MSILEDINLFMATVDIDGTIKDLAKENTNALTSVMKKMGNLHLTLRGKFVLWINKVNMYFVKTGLLPTNSFMRDILLFVYSAFLLKNHKNFKRLYFKEYNKENVFFERAEDMIQNIIDSGLIVYLITKNSQNRRIMALKDNNIVKKKLKLIIGNKKTTKYAVYRSFISNKFLQENELLIVGDNFWDDVLPGIFLGATVVWCNMYNSKLKKVVINILKLFFRKIKDDRELFITN